MIFRRTSGGVAGLHFLVFLSLLAPPLLSLAQAGNSVSGSEMLGEIAISDFFVEPSFSYQEPNRGVFSLGHSFVETRWVQPSDLVSASLKVGTRRLLGEPARYGVSDREEEIGLIEVFGQIEGTYGRLRMGLVPIPYGLEGGNSESSLRISRSQLYQRRIINVRDYGIVYRIENAGFFSDWAAHNGEGRQNLDNETWFTARWGWQGGKYLRLGFSGSAGRTSPEATNPAGLAPGAALDEASDQAGIQIDQPSKMRFANGFISWHDGRFRLQSEVTAGDVVQSSQERKLRAFYLDLEAFTSEHLSFLARYDIFDPDTVQSNNALRELTLGLGLQTRHATSVFNILGTRINSEGAAVSEHRLLVIWRLTPTVRDRLSDF
jgi:hypothetical protein